jgi:hypothetical protein
MTAAAASRGVARLQAANRANVIRQGEIGRQASALQSEADRRRDPAAAGVQALTRIASVLRDVITDGAPSASVSTGIEPWWTIALNAIKRRYENVRAWARQVIAALLALKKAAAAARDAGEDGIGARQLAGHVKDFENAAKAGIALNAARRSALQKKRQALAKRLRDRADDYLPFARDLRVPFDNYPDAAVMPMFAVRGGCAAGQGGALAA